MKPPFSYYTHFGIKLNNMWKTVGELSVEMEACKEFELLPEQSKMKAVEISVDI